MAKSSTIKLRTKFKAKKSVKHVSRGELNKKDDTPTLDMERTLGKTKPRATIVYKKFKWREDKGEGGIVKLSIDKLIVEIDATTDVLLDKEVDKRSACYAHIKAHEIAHVKLYKEAFKKSETPLNSALIKAAFPTAEKPEEVAANAVTKTIEGHKDRIHRALLAALKAEMKKAKKHSEKIHTPGEKKATYEKCFEYIAL